MAGIFISCKPYLWGSVSFRKIKKNKNKNEKLSFFFFFSMKLLLYDWQPKSKINNNYWPKWRWLIVVFTDATSLISCLIGFVLSCFYESKFSCSLVWLERYNCSFYWALTLSINTRVADQAAIEPDRGVKSGVGSLKVGSWTWEVGSWKSEVGNRKSEVGSRKPRQKWEVGSGK